MTLQQPPRRVAVFGGTFDPVHQGHLAIAAAARRECKLDRVVFVPCQQSPHKSEPAAATGEQRRAMLELATEDLAWATVDSFELERSGPSFSWETARHFRETAAEKTALFWILGADQWDAIDRWKHPARLAGTVAFIVFARGGITPRSRPGFDASFVTAELHPASATKIRSAIARGETVPEGWLDRRVAGYILKSHLYAE